MKYTCFNCGKKATRDLIGKKIRCPFCGGKILYKSREVATKLKAV